MLTTIRSQLRNLITQVYKHLTLALFFILPIRVAATFVSLSILALIYDLKKIDVKKKNFNEDKLNQLLKISFSEEIMTLPSYTVHWFWKEDILNKSVMIDNQSMTLKDIIKNDNLLHKNLRFVTDTLLENIPKSLKFKLNLTETKDRLIMKHNVMNLVMYG